MSTAVWVEIGTGPRAAFYMGRRPPPAAALPPIALPFLADIGKLRRPLGLGVESVNMDVAIDNPDGSVADLLSALSPVIVVRTMRAGLPETVLTGRLSGGFRGDQRLTGRVVAETLLDAPKLRPASELPSFAGSGRIPRVFGPNVTLSPIPYSDDGRQYLISDAPITRIRSVIDKGGPIDAAGYALANQADDTGRPVALLLLAEAPQEPDALVVVVDGETGTDGGAPADLIEALQSLQDTDPLGARLDRLRQQSRGMVLRGVVDDAYDQTREVLDDLFQSIGGRWSAQAAHFGGLWPVERGDNDPLDGFMDTRSAWDVVSDPLERVGQLIVNYAYDWSAGRYAKALLLRAPEEIRRAGRTVESELSLRWIGDDALAEQIGRATLSYMAAERYTVTWTTGPGAARAQPGQWWSLSHPHSRLSGVWPLSEAAVDLLAGEVDLSVEGYRGSLATVELVRRTVLLEIAGRAVRVVKENGRQIIIAADENGEPLPGATVTVDGRQYTADGSGRVAVEGLTPGRSYQVTIESPGRAPVATTIEAL